MHNIILLQNTYIEGGDANTVVHSSQLKMKLTGTIIHPGKLMYL